MKEELIDIKIYHLTNQVDRLVNIVDKLCNRIELLELDLADRKLKKKIITFLFALYPLVMLILTFSINLDQNKINNLIKDYTTLIEHE